MKETEKFRKQEEKAKEKREKMVSYGLAIKESKAPKVSNEKK